MPNAETVFRRLGLWTVLCSVSALPSFFWAHRGYDRFAMFCGVVLFICLYTIATCTRKFEAFHARPFIRRTLYIGYGARVAFSVLFPLGMFVDLFVGMASVRVANHLLGGPPLSQNGTPPGGATFTNTLVTTIIQGALLNVVIFLFMLVVYGIQRVFLNPPAPPPTGLCKVCGYDLRASPIRCPECGTPVAEQAPARSALPSEQQIASGG